MFNNYLKLTWRNLIRNKIYSLINIVGLAFGMAAALFIFEYVSFEASFDQHIDRASHKYRVYNDRYQNGELIQHGTITYPMVGPTLARDYPEVLGYTRLFPYGGVPLQVGENVYLEDNALIADEHFLDFFSVDLVAGDIKTALKEYNAIAISTSNAQRFFGLSEKEAHQAIGKTIEISEDRNACKITAVYKPFPENSHLEPHLIMSYQTLITDVGKNQAGEFTADVSRNWSDYYHYVELDPQTPEREFEAKLAQFGVQYFEEGEISGSVEKFYLQPLSEAYLYSDFEYEIGRTNNGKAIQALWGIGIFILFIAWINYINLTTARSLDRAREVGVRKVMGARKGQLVRQFLVESLTYNLLGLLLAVTLVQLLQPFLNSWLGKSLHISQLLQSSPLFLGSVLIIWILGVLGSGIYPAWLIAGFRPVSVLKGKITRNNQGILLRKGLVVFQFACSLLLILATFAVYKQLQFMQKESLGIDLKQKLVVHGPVMNSFDSTFINRVQTLKNEWERIPQVKAVASSMQLAGDRLPRTFNVTSDVRGPENAVMLNRMNIDHDFVEVYGLELTHGRSFVRSDHKTSFQELNVIMLNESAARLLGYPDPGELLNQEIKVSNKPWEVVGIVKDFHQRSLRYAIEPLIFLPTYSTYDSYTLLISANDLDQTLQKTEEIYASVFPGNNFSYFFMDERFQEQYVEDKRFGQLFGLFALLAIGIACLGLFGLSSYNMKQRTKEIGIRKVLGAQVDQLLLLLSKEYFLLMALAGLIAIPLSVLFLSSWLSNYAFAFSYGLDIFSSP